MIGSGCLSGLGQDIREFMNGKLVGYSNTSSTALNHHHNDTKCLLKSHIIQSKIDAEYSTVKTETAKKNTAFLSQLMGWLVQLHMHPIPFSAVCFIGKTSTGGKKQQTRARNDV
jgi:hypothetical protein